MPFFTELAAIYRRYRVTQSWIKISFANSEAFNMLVYVLPMNLDPTSNSAAYQSYLSNPLCKAEMVGPLTGQNRADISHYFAVSKFAGSADAQLDDYYSASTAGSAAPVNNIWWCIGSLAQSNQVSGMTISFQLWIEAEFYELTTPSA